MTAFGLFRRLPGRRSKPGGAVGKRAYVIGDIHGRADLLEALLSQIESDIDERSSKKNILVFLGDTIDRGPDSKSVIELLLRRIPASAQACFIMGNHEESMVRAMQGETALIRPWLAHGGAATAMSYGIRTRDLAGRSDDALLEILRAAIPSEHVNFLASFRDYAVFGDYLFVHAGVRPGRSPEAQNPRDLRWIREPFLNCNDAFSHVVVHGHTVSDQPVMRHNRIGIDTGAYASGILTALMIEGAETQILQTVGAGAAESLRSSLDGSSHQKSKFGLWYRGAA